MKSERKVRRKVTTETTVTLTREDILDLIRAKYGDVFMPDVYVPVPGGGDWSNTNLEIEGDRGIVVTWKNEVISND